MNKYNRDCLFYYGTEVPKLSRTIGLNETNVILQDYHPIVAQGLYGEFFPLCKRFIYLNVSHVHRNELVNFDISLKGLKYNEEWQTYLLDLEQPLTFDLILKKAKKILSIEGVDGLFFDDVDFWATTPSLRMKFVELVEAIKRESKKEIRFILNRGFPFWTKLSSLEAIVLENIFPEKIYTSAYQDLSWFETLLTLNFSVLKERDLGIPVYGLKYSGNDDDVTFDRDFENAERRDSLFAEMNKNIFKTLKYERNFDRWPTQLIS